MEQVLGFPGLGLEFELDRVAFYLPEFMGSRPIYWYGICIAIGFLVAVLYIAKCAHVFGLDSDRAFDVTIITIICGIIGARAYYVMFSWDQYKDNLADIIRTDKGGLAIYGGIIFGLIGLIVGCKIRQVKVIPMADLTVGGVIIAQAIGRWGNFFNIEAFGGNTNLPWGMTSPIIRDYLETNQQVLADIGMIVDPAKPVHPTFLYESLWCLLGFAIILFIIKKRKFDGQISLFYFAWYGLGRMFIEGLRTDSLMVGQSRISQLVALACFVLATISIIVILRKIKKTDNPTESRLYVDTKESELILEGSFYKDSESKNEKSKESSDKDESDKDDVFAALDVAIEKKEKAASEAKEKEELEENGDIARKAKDKMES